MIKLDIRPEELVHFNYCWLQFILCETCVVFIKGGTIADLIQEKKKGREGKWPVLLQTDSLGYLEDVLKAVKFLHSKGLVHMDIKGKVKNRIFSTSVHPIHKHFKKGLQARNDVYVHVPARNGFY